MSDVILKIEKISKQYRLGVVGSKTIKDDLKRFWYRIRGKEDPFLKIGAVNNTNAKDQTDYVWALQDINLEVKRGEVVGIIGKNGAGKSTLLKILSKITSPTIGIIKTKGRIASLLEVGTGFHPELTGRENIFLNGAILGMTRKEIEGKLEEIIDFSGCDLYIDTPVKRYSSGMRVRLAFAVAAFLEPDILIVDEVLAVGDAEFQKKAIGKMQDISSAGGRTVLFVSHNMVSVENLCSRVVVLKNGKISFDGDTMDGIQHYLESSRLENIIENQYGGIIKIEDFKLINALGQIVESAILGSKISFRFRLMAKIKIDKFVFKILVKDQKETPVLILNNYHLGQFFNLVKGENILNCVIDKFPLFGGVYWLDIEFLDLNHRNRIGYFENVLSINVSDGDFYNTGRIPEVVKRGVFMVEHNWTQHDLS